MLDRARASAPAATCVHGDLHGFEGSGRFDVALCLGVLSHVDSTEAALAAVARCLRPGGRAVVQFSDCETLSTRLFRLCRRGGLDCRATSLADVTRAAESVGLRPVASQRHLLLLPGLRRLLGRRLLGWDRFVMRRPWLSRHAMDAIVLFEREDRSEGASDAGMARLESA